MTTLERLTDAAKEVGAALAKSDPARFARLWPEFAAALGEIARGNATVATVYDARLIAAAPEMLALLREEYDDQMPDTGRGDRARRARSLLAKIDGGAA